MSTASLARFTRTVKPVPRLVKITQVKSGCKAQRDVQETLKALQLGKMHKSVVHKNISPIRGMINSVKGYVLVEDYAIPEWAKNQTKNFEQQESPQ